MSTSFRTRSDSGLSSSGPADDLGDDVEDDVQCDVGDDVEDDVELWRTTWRTTWPSLEDDVAEASVLTGYAGLVVRNVHQVYSERNVFINAAERILAQEVGGVLQTASASTIVVLLASLQSLRGKTLLEYLFANLLHGGHLVNSRS